MNQFLALLKLQYASKRANFADKKSNAVFHAIKLIFVLIGVVLFEALIGLLFYRIFIVFNKQNLQMEILIFVIFLVQLGIVVFGVGKTTKSLYRQNDSQLLKYPVSGTKIYFCKILFLFINQFVFAFLICMPIFVCYGIVFNCSYVFYLLIPVDVLLITILPFCILLFLSIVVNKIKAIFHNKNLFLLIFYVVVITLFFYLYTKLLQITAEYFRNVNANEIISESTAIRIKYIFKFLYIQVLVKNIILNVNLISSLLCYILIVSALFSLVVVVAKKFYLKQLVSSSDSENSFGFSKKRIFKTRGAKSALFKKEILLIFRSPNYSFQFLTMVLVAPFLVYLCNKIVINLSNTTLSNSLIYGISILTIIMFLTLGCSFCATSISREGDKLFLTKTFPVKYRTQIFVKFLSYLTFCVPSVILSSLFIACIPYNFFTKETKQFFMPIVPALIICGAIMLVVIGSIASAINLDLKKPKHYNVGSGEIVTTTSNVNLTLTLGLVISAVLGVASLFVSLFFNLSILYVVIYGFSVPFSIIEIICLFASVQKRYKRIDV